MQKAVSRHELQRPVVAGARFNISVAAAAPWPALKVAVQVQVPDGAVALSAFHDGAFPFKVDAVDLLLLRRLMQLPRVGDAYTATARDFASVLALLRQHSPACQYAEDERVARVSILSEPAEIVLELLASAGEEAVRATASLRHRSAEDGRELGEPLVRGTTYWTFAEAIAPPPQCPRDALLKSLVLNTAGTREFLGTEALDLICRARAAANSGELGLHLDPALTTIPVAAQPLQKRVSVELDGDGNLEVRQQLTTADGQVVDAGDLKTDDGRGWVNVSGRLHRRPDDAAHFTLAAPRKIRGEEVPQFLAEELPALRAEAASAFLPLKKGEIQRGSVSPWNIYVASAVDGAHKIKDDPANLRFSLDVEEEQDDKWFTLNVAFDHDGQALTEDELRALIRDGKKWFRKGNTWVRIDAEALKKFDESVKRSGLRRHFGRRRQFYYRFKPTERERVTDIFSLSGTLEHAEKYQQFLDRLRDFNAIERLPLPKDMKLPLRPYQQQGFEWLCFLAQYGLNGILADDMGLGKTAQTIALLARMKEVHGPAPSLIVTPTSLADNWRFEIAKFNPSLKVLLYRGNLARRDHLRWQMGDYDVVLATYATARNDASLLRDVGWRYVIVDEAHFIKNSAAATTKAIKTIPARHRLALTGTPIQNRLAELWSLFDFLMPEFLGRRARFTEIYEEPIARVQSGRAETRDEQDDGQRAMEHLRDRIRPFVLRRLKTDVAGELPPKIENDIFCGLSPEQIALYRGFADSAEAKEAVHQVVTKGADRACTAILAALTSLRKICNHPDLMCLPKNAGRQRIARPLPGYRLRSGKLEALGDLLEECRDGGHRALIFCQLTTMLDILGHFLDELNIKHLRLDGETPGTERLGLVDKFNADSSYEAFLISTRAGGTGLNLTGADTVIFYDHDWNPANDQQAQDRAYRIGQHKTVNVYRLICKGTLEEKILRRQALKRLLASSIIQQDVGGVKELSREELLNLFSLSE